MNDTERLVDLFESLSSAHETEAVVRGWSEGSDNEFDSVAAAFSAGKAVGRSTAFDQAASYVGSTEDE